MFADKTDGAHLLIRASHFLGGRIKCVGHGEIFHLRMMLELGCGIKLLPCGYSALALTATLYRRCYILTFAIDHRMRLILSAQKIRTVNLAPSHHHAHRDRTSTEATF